MQKGRRVRAQEARDKAPVQRAATAVRLQGIRVAARRLAIQSAVRGLGARRVERLLVVAARHRVVRQVERAVGVMVVLAGARRGFALLQRRWWATPVPERAECALGATRGSPSAGRSSSVAGGEWARGSLPGVVGAEEGIGRECHEPPAGACPATSPAGTNCPAELDRTRCQYSDGTLCACLVNYCNDDVCAPLPSPEWLCNQILPPCPGAVPNAGAPAPDRKGRARTTTVA